MIEDHVERKIILNENDSRTMSSLRVTVNKKTTQQIHLLNFLFQNAFTGNVAIDISISSRLSSLDLVLI